LPNKRNKDRFRKRSPAMIMDEIIKLRRDLEEHLKKDKIPVPLVANPREHPAWIVRGLWLLEHHPRVAIHLMLSKLLEEELKHAVNLAEGLLEHHKNLTLVLGMVAPPAENLWVGEMSEDLRNEYLRLLEMRN
jgi:hypothetical protein